MARLSKCQWCDKPENVITLYEMYEDRTISEPTRVCLKHLYPGVDPCPYKAYLFVPDLKVNKDKVKVVYRVWKSGQNLKDTLAQRLEWFRSHSIEEELYSCPKTTESSSSYPDLKRLSSFLKK